MYKCMIGWCFVFNLWKSSSPDSWAMCHLLKPTWATAKGGTWGLPKAETAHQSRHHQIELELI